MLKTEHIGIAVKDLSASVSLFEKLLQTSCYKTEIVESEKVATAFLQVGETKIELLESQTEYEPKNGADNKLVCFLHPKNTNSVLIEICQQKK